MDKSLDDIVKSSRTGRRGTGRRPNRSARAKILGTTSTTAAKTAARKTGAVTQVAGKVTLPQQAAEKIMVSGLPTDVNEQQIKELFTTTVGPLRDVQLHFNPQGKWNGTATVLFTRKGDGTKAFEQYNNRLIDGKRPMKIELVFDPSKVPPPPLVSRVAPAPKAATVVAGGALKEGVQRTGGRPRRARGARTKNQRPQKTVEDLDAEMEDYTAGSNAPVTVAAPTA